MYFNTCARKILYARPVEDGFNVGDNKKEDEIWILLLYEKKLFLAKCFVSQCVVTSPLTQSSTANNIGFRGYCVILVSQTIIQVSAA